MTMTVDTFAEKIFSYIHKQYGKNSLNTVQSASNKIAVDKLIESSKKQNDTVEHAANKIVAMLRMNP
jgi:hypothetical protein